MTKPAHRTRRLRKIFYRTPGGETRTRYERRGSRKACCQLCEKKLLGKRPGRKFSKALCHACAAAVITARARVKEGTLRPEEVRPKLRQFL